VDQLKGAAKHNIHSSHILRWLGPIAFFDFSVSHALRSMSHDDQTTSSGCSRQNRMYDRMLAAINAEKRAIIIKTHETLGHREIEV
jgi:hypothetical protein